jgi:hypothetical protein
MLGFEGVANSIAANGVISLVRRAVTSVTVVFQGSKQLKLQFESTLHKNSILQGALNLATHNLDSITDYITHLDASSGAFDLEKVLVAAHTMRLFKAPMPTVQRSGRHTNALHIDCGREQGVIPGMSISLQSRRGDYEEIYVVENRDIRDDHICAQPRNFDFSRTEVADLIVSFILAEILNPLESNLAALLDISMSGVDESRAAIGRTAIQVRWT